MKKKRNVVILFLIIFFSFLPSIYASTTGIVNVNDSLNLRSGPGSNYSIITSLYNATVVNVISTNAASGNGCDSNWYHVSYGNYDGYVCGDYIIIKQESSDNIVNQDNSYLKSDYDTKSSYDGSIMCYEDSGNLGLRSTAGGARTGKSVSCGELVNINSVQESSSSCPYYYNIITSGGDTGWVCGYFVNTTKLSETANNYYNTKENLNDYYNFLLNKGFPSSYLSYLAEMHARHPNWNFEAEKVNLNFTDVVNNESVDGRSLLEGTAFDNGFKSMASHTYNILNDTFSDYEDEPGWYNASSLAVAYFMDPRNYLNVKYIFAFESLLYNSEHDVRTISSILNQSFWNDLYDDGSTGASNDLINACSVVGISSVHVASRIKQEVSGLTTADSRIGGNFTYSDNNISGYYNFFNIKSACLNCSSIYAGYAYENGWDTPYKGIYGGANFIYGNYAAINQDTMYYEKFDVSTTDGNYTHQYMQNLAASVQETNTTYNSYFNIDGYISLAHTFTIPVYDNMSNYAVTSPRIGNPNNYLNDLTLNGNTISNFSYDTYNYNVHLTSDVTVVNIGASTINSNANVSGTGNVDINSNDMTKDIIVTAQNGKKRIYTIRFTRDADSSITTIEAMNNSGFKYNDNYVFGINVGTNVSEFIGNITSYNNSTTVVIKDSSGNIKTNASFKTGDIVSVTGSDGTKIYTALIYGDVNGDGFIDKNDLLYVQSAVFGYVNLNSLKTSASDINKDGKVDKNDLLYVQSHVFGYSTINQG